MLNTPLKQWTIALICLTALPTLASAAEPDLAQQVKALTQEVGQMKAELGQIKQGFAEMRKMMMPPPEPPAPSQVNFDGAPSLGSKDAKVAIIEFSDFQCPYCARHSTQTFPELKKTYIDTGRVRYLFRNLPLDFHNHAKAAANAASCAGEQNAFWPMHDELFANHTRLGTALYEELAKKLDLNQGAFQKCLTENRHAATIDKDLAYAQSVGVRGTPNFFVGRIQGDTIVDVQQVSGAQPAAAFAQVIDELLK